MASRWALTGGVLAFVAALHGHGAVGAAATPVDSAVKADARERFDRGLSLFEKGENAAALAEFKRAFELIPNPIVLYNMGLVYAAMSRPVDAVDALDRFFAAAGDKASPEQKRQGGKVRAEQASRIARLVVVTNRPSTVEIDGVEAGHAPMAQPLAVPSGAHTITAIAPGFQPSRREVTLAGQVTETIALTLVPTETGAAHLTVTTFVPGAEVWINDKNVGMTPLPATIAVSPGDVRVEVRRAGYRPSAKAMHLDEGATARVELALEEDPAANVTKRRLGIAVSDPGSSELSIDGSPRTFSPEGVPLIPGPHVVRVDRVGFERYERIVQVDATRDTSIAVELSPTFETAARVREATHTRGIIGWSLVGAGVAVTVGAVVFAAVTRHDVANAQAALDKQVALEKMVTVNGEMNICYIGTDPNMLPAYYASMGCAATKSGLQDDVDSAKLKRSLAYAGAGVGVLAAGVGTYLLVTRNAQRSVSLGSDSLGLWIDPHSAGVDLSARF